MTTPNTVPLTWNTWVSAVANLAVEDVSLIGGVMTGNANFNQALATAISYSELRIERDLDLLALETTRTYTLTSGNNILPLSANDFVTVRTIEAAGVPLLPVSKEFIQNCYGSASASGPPIYFAMYGGDLATGGNVSNNVLLGPPPDQPYATTVTGTIRMPSLYLTAISPTAATATSWISTNLPDALIMCAMVSISAYQRNFSGMSANDPQMPVSYETQYQELMSAAKIEELRKRFTASAWSSTPTSVAATPTR